MESSQGVRIFKINKLPYDGFLKVKDIKESVQQGLMEIKMLSRKATELNGFAFLLKQSS